MKKILTLILPLFIFSITTKAEIIGNKNKSLAEEIKIATNISSSDNKSNSEKSSINITTQKLVENTRLTLACGVTLDVSLPPVNNYDYSGLTNFINYLDWVFCQGGFITMIYFAL